MGKRGGQYVPNYFSHRGQHLQADDLARINFMLPKVSLTSKPENNGATFGIFLEEREQVSSGENVSQTFIGNVRVLEEYRIMRSNGEVSI